MRNIYKLATLLIILCLCFAVTGCNSGKQKDITKETLKNAQVGDYVEFGNYPQTANGEIQPIKWLVLARKGKKMLVVSKYGLDAKRFDDDSNDWKDSEIRQWLNSDFYNKAFNEKDKQFIKSFEGDKVFLLSKEDAEKYFFYDSARRCKPTDYAIKNGAMVYKNNLEKVEAGYSYWLLRTPYPSFSNSLYYVDGDGAIYFIIVQIDDVLIRPALWIKT